MAVPLLAVGDVLQITLKGLLFGQRTNNTFHYNVTATDGDQTFTEVFSQWVVDYEDLWCACVSQDWTGDVVTVRRLTPTKTRGVDFDIAWIGTIPSASLPPSTAAVISRWNYGSGQSNRGRVFIPGIPATSHVAGRILSTGANPFASFLLLAAQMDDPCEDVPDFSLAPGLFHRFTNTWEAIEGTTARDILRQQRRREIGVGE